MALDLAEERHRHEPADVNARAHGSADVFDEDDHDERAEEPGEGRRIAMRETCGATGVVGASANSTTSSCASGLAVPCWTRVLSRPANALASLAAVSGVPFCTRMVSVRLTSFAVTRVAARRSLDVILAPTWLIAASRRGFVMTSSA